MKLRFLTCDDNVCWTDPVVQSLLRGPFKLVFDLLRGGHLQRVFDLAVRQSRLLGCLGTQTGSESLLNLSKQNQAGPAGTSANDAASVMSLSSLQIRLHSSRDTCSTSLSPPFSCSCTAVTKRIADREPGGKWGKLLIHT